MIRRIIALNQHYDRLREPYRMLAAIILVSPILTLPPLGGICYLVVVGVIRLFYEELGA